VHSKDPFKGSWGHSEDLVNMVENTVKKFDIHIYYNREVLLWKFNANGTVQVTWKDLLSDKETTENFAGIHLRMGAINPKFQNKSSFVGKEKFKGIIRLGTANDVKTEDLKHKHVVVSGCGAMALDNARRALMANAASITILAKIKTSIVAPAAIFQLFSMFNPVVADPVNGPKFIQDTYTKAFSILRKMWKATGMSDFCDDNGCILHYDGADHLQLHKHFPGCRGDDILLAAYYGLVKFEVGEINHLTEMQVVTKLGKSYPCDVLFTTWGFNVSDNIIFTNGHAMQDFFWIDGKPNATQLLFGDRLPVEVVLGHDIPGRKILLLSYPIWYITDCIIVDFLNNPEKFKNFKQFAPYSSVSIRPSVVNGLDCYEKIFQFKDPQHLQLIGDTMAQKRKQYEKLLPPKLYYSYLKHDWDELNELWSKKTGKPKLEYPLVEQDFS